jgi:hypothetical protein
VRWRAFEIRNSLIAAFVLVTGCFDDLSCDGERSSSSARRRNLSRAARGASPVDLGEGGGERRGAQGQRASAGGEADVTRRFADAGFSGRADSRRRVRYRIISPTSTERGGCFYFEKGKKVPTHARSLAEVPIDYRDEAACASRRP